MSAISAKKRKDCYDRDGWKCAKCGVSSDLTVDHIIPISKGGKCHLKNLQTLCKPCNQAKGDAVWQYTKHKGTKRYLIAHLQWQKNPGTSPGKVA